MGYIGPFQDFQDAGKRGQSGTVSIPLWPWSPATRNQKIREIKPLFLPPSIYRDIYHLIPIRLSNLLLLHTLAESRKKVIRLTKKLASITAEILWGFLISAPIMSHWHVIREDTWFVLDIYSWPWSNSIKKPEVSFYFVLLKFLANIHRSTLPKSSHCVCLKSVLFRGVILGWLLRKHVWYPQNSESIW